MKDGISYNLYVALPEGVLLSAKVIDGIFDRGVALEVSRVSVSGNIDMVICASPREYTKLVRLGSLPHGLLELPRVSG